MKYELLRDLPGVKAGSMFVKVNEHGIYAYRCDNFAEDCTVFRFPQSDVENNPDWFRPVRWEPETGEKYWVVTAEGTLFLSVNADYLCDRDRISFGNCFPTKESAEKALAEIREVLKKNMEE